MNNVKVKNRAPAAIQITAEQLLREARERQEDTFRAPTEKIADTEELKEYQVNKRKEFEDLVRKNRQNVGWYMKYAKWEESQMEYRRARSVYERAIDQDYKNASIWLRYAEFEMRCKFVNHARNIWDRAVTLLPRVSQLWYKYSYMEEMLGKVDNARTIFERWMRWEPEEQAWFSYIKLEERAGEMKRARDLYERFCACHVYSGAYVKYAKWEERHAQKALAREVFERSLEELPVEERDQRLYIEFAKFEERCKEFERTRAIYQVALDALPKEEARELYNAFVSFEKQHGNKQGVEDVIVAKRRSRYESEVKEDPSRYDSWFDYIRLEEAQVNAEIEMSNNILTTPTVVDAIYRAREVYERAISTIPDKSDKTYWRRYIYLWINYALFEELITKDLKRTREVYKACLKVIPHKNFSFSKIWIMFAHFEVRCKDIPTVRKIFGQAIGRCPKEKIFRAYIQLELQLGNVDRCRVLYEKYLEFMPENANTWIKFAELESFMKEDERSRAVFELAVNQPMLDRPELLWKRYIDFEISLGEEGKERAIILYDRLMERTKHVKVWISFARFYALDCNRIEEARSQFQNGYNYLKTAEPGVVSGMKEERVLLLDAWIEVEEKLVKENKTDTTSLEKVHKMQPKKVKKKRQIFADDGSPAGWEEYFDYIFPDDPKQANHLKFLEMAQKWKRGGGASFGNATKKQKTDDDKPKGLMLPPASKVVEDENEIDID